MIKFFGEWVDEIAVLMTWIIDYSISLQEQIFFFDFDESFCFFLLQINLAAREIFKWRFQAVMIRSTSIQIDPFKRNLLFITLLAIMNKVSGVSA